MPEHRIDICTFYQERVAASQVWERVRQTLWQLQQQALQHTIESWTRVPRVKRMGLSDTGASMMMDWTYAKRISFDHAFWCNGGSRRRRRRKVGMDDGASVVLAASLILWSLVGFWL